MEGIAGMIGRSPHAPKGIQAYLSFSGWSKQSGVSTLVGDPEPGIWVNSSDVEER